MGKRGGMKGRPGFLFVVFICICVVLFYLSWQMLMSPKFERSSSSQVVQNPQSLSKVQSQEWKNIQFQQYATQKGRKYDYESGRNNLNNVQIDHPPIFDNNPGEVKKETLVHWERGPKADASYVGSNQNDADNFNFDPAPKSTPKSEKNSVQFHKAHSSQNGIYFEPHFSSSESIMSMERLVHLDFKGAVPKMSYLREVIPLFRSLGATGLLVEYEDMFPFHGSLEVLRAADAFSKEQLKEFLQLVKKHNMNIMPLVQTFGHMEFILKKAFPDLRESVSTPQVVDMTNNKSHALISEMISQILQAHPDITHLHIGCDEVYELGRGASATVMSKERVTEGEMFLRHVKQVASIVISASAQKVIPVMWDDMLRKISTSDILKSKLASMVEIMIWQYTTNVTKAISSEVFKKYEEIFGSVWIASSFKGATGSRQFYTESIHHLRNHYSWLEVIDEHHKSLKFSGIALTGWQRYDHFATLCELLPVAIPSLAVCLATFQHAAFTEEHHKAASNILKCDKEIELSFPEVDTKTGKARISQDCRFPGSDLYYAMQDFYGYTQISTQHRVDGWLSDYQVAHHFSNPGQLKVLGMDLIKQRNGFTRTEGPLKKHLSAIYSFADVQEWLEENIYEKKRHIEKYLDKVNMLLEPKTWPQRPLPDISFINQIEDGHKPSAPNSQGQKDTSLAVNNLPQESNSEIAKVGTRDVSAKGVYLQQNDVKDAGGMRNMNERVRSLPQPKHDLLHQKKPSILKEVSNGNGHQQENYADLGRTFKYWKVDGDSEVEHSKILKQATYGEPGVGRNQLHDTENSMSDTSFREAKQTSNLNAYQRKKNFNAEDISKNAQHQFGIPKEMENTDGLNQNSHEETIKRQGQQEHQRPMSAKGDRKGGYQDLNPSISLSNALDSQLSNSNNQPSVVKSPIDGQVYNFVPGNLKPGNNNEKIIDSTDKDKVDQFLYSKSNSGRNVGNRVNKDLLVNYHRQEPKDLEEKLSEHSNVGSYLKDKGTSLKALSEGKINSAKLELSGEWNAANNYKIAVENHQDQNKGFESTHDHEALDHGQSINNDVINGKDTFSIPLKSEQDDSVTNLDKVGKGNAHVLLHGPTGFKSGNANFGLDVNARPPAGDQWSQNADHSMQAEFHDAKMENYEKKILDRTNA